MSTTTHIEAAAESPADAAGISTRTSIRELELQALGELTALHRRTVASPTQWLMEMIGWDLNLTTPADAG